MVDLQLRDLVLGGVALGHKERARFNAVQQELAQVGWRWGFGEWRGGAAGEVACFKAVQQGAGAGGLGLGV